MPKETLTVTDNRTGRQYEIPIEHGAIRATDLSQIRTGPDDGGIVSYDPALVNTASCRSQISFIDGDKGILRYRGYPIEELAERSSYLEVAYLIVKGELPTTTHFAMWQHNIKMHTMLHESVKRFIDGFRYDAHPMGILVGTVGALSTFYPNAKHVTQLESRRMETRRLIAKMPTIAAYA
jgi:citrate synthase